MRAKLLKIFFKMNLAEKGIVFEMKRSIMTHLDTDFTSEPIEKLVCINFIY